VETIHTSSYPIASAISVHSSDTPTESIIDAVIANRHRLVEVGVPLGDVDVTVIPATPTSPEVTVTVARHQKHKALVTATGAFGSRLYAQVGGFGDWVGGGDRGVSFLGD
jgi:hypothetical protein